MGTVNRERQPTPKSSVDIRFRLVHPVYNMDTYVFNVEVLIKQAKYE